MSCRILLVEDKDSLRRMTRLALEGEGHTVTDVATVATGIDAVETDHHDLVITDLMLPDGQGLEVVRAVRQHRSGVPVVVLTAFGSVSMAVEAMKLGATDFLEKPLELDDLFALVDRLAGPSTAEPEAFEAPGAPPIVGHHPTLRAALRLLERVAPTESTVLLTGESGTGKEVFARSLHGLSKRATGPFVAVNCAAIPEALVENELFGHEKGAFTGASRRQEGRVGLARGGTLFLDEIGELPLDIQAKILRVLEERVFERVGGGAPIAAEVRIVAATNRELQSMVAAGTFRQDLYYRLDVFPIELPPLRERASDIPELARHLLGRLAERVGAPPPEPTDAALQRLADEPWPGNVRQLANALERATILCEGPVLDRADIELVLGASTPLPGDADTEPSDDEQSLRDALLATDGDKRAAAERLGVSYRTLQRRIRQHDLEGFPRYRS